MKLLLYTPLLTNRIRYVTDLVFKELLGLTLILTTDQNHFLASELPKLNYSREVMAGTMLFLPQGNLLLETKLQTQHIEVYQVQGLPAFFACDFPMADYNFDVLSLIFYLVTRYEEYLPFASDAHNRFPAKESLAYRAGFLDEPLINHWVAKLKISLTEKYPTLSFVEPKYQFLPSYDIDIAWSYRHKGIYRQLAGYARDLLHFNLSQLQRRIKVQLGMVTDPYFVFDYLNELHQKLGLSPYYFFLLGDYGPFDKSNQITARAFQDLLHTTAKQYRTGIHPSYASHDEPQKLSKEIARLQSATGQPVKNSRQHFLKLRFPESYQALIAEGITADYTMGYAAQTGFRASIAQSFWWYDLSKEASTNLRIFPFQVMDVTLKRYQKLEPAAALRQVQDLIDKTKAVNGVFVSLWHNSSLTEIEGWENWRSVYEEILRRAKA
ncbi:MAG: polysaccharide deacetylase family protein [Saprospiraceae bacterium]